jgi:hypothetical protein
MKLAFGILTAGIVVIIVGTTAFSQAYSGVVRRHCRVVEDLPPYGDELRSLSASGDSPSVKRPTDNHSGPGWYPRRSPDGTRVAVTTSWGGFLGEVVLGLLIDRPFIHTVSIWEESRATLVPVVSIKEADPHSGIAHRYAWSKDSKALLIYGGGRLPEDYDLVVGTLCVVYLPGTDDLVRLANCPPEWQRGRTAERAAPQNKEMQLTRSAHGLAGRGPRS